MNIGTIEPALLIRARCGAGYDTTGMAFWL